MKQGIVFTILMVMTGMLLAGRPMESFNENQTYHGFSLKEKRFVPEVNAECLFFIHEQSGAQLIKIAADDPNKLFNIAFNTLPENSTGVAHIMEHSVLNGSQSFPVKSPFNVLRRGSLNTFLNAMTGSDFTTYPVASMNEKDYFNLMHVYLDATLLPRIYDDPRIFLQEGWHYEIEEPEAEIVYKGVVFNEMKGAYSSPNRELYYQSWKVLFPDNTYGNCSGGYPSEIPRLTYEEFLNFHRTFYHPSNSYITLYGNADLDKELAFINENYLSRFTRSDAVIELPMQKPFDRMKELETPYAVAEGNNIQDNTYLLMNFVAGQGINQEFNMAMEVIADALVNHESAPLRIALQEAGLGKNVSAGLKKGKQNQFLILLQNANREDRDRFREIVFQTMKEVADKGFDKEMLEGIINRKEFQLREGNTSAKGMMYMMASYINWMFDGDPFAGLEFEKPLAYVKQSLEQPILENLMEEYLIQNPHAVLVAMYPQPGLEQIHVERERQELAEYKASLSKEEIDALVQQTKELKQYQLSEDSPEALASVPMLSLEDISPEVNWYPLQEKKFRNAPVFHYEDFTNDIIYIYLYFDMRTLPQKLIPYASLLSALIREMGTETKSVGELDNALNIHTGSFWTTLDSYLQNQSDEQLLPFFLAGGKAMSDKTGTFFELAAEIINTFNLEDRERLKTILTRHQAVVERRITNDGLNFANLRLLANFNKQGIFNEMTRGISYYRFVTELNNEFDTRSDEMIARLRETASLLFNQNNISVQVTCAENNYGAFEDGFKSFLASLPNEKPVMQTWSLEYLPANEGLLSASKVQYVTQGYDFKKLGYSINGHFYVLNQILSTDYLQNKIRVMGGAYGGFSTLNPTGPLFFSSYRDPNLKETLDNFEGLPQYLENFEADDMEMTRYIIGTIAKHDQPRTPSVSGQFALWRHYENVSHEDLLKERQEILNTSAGDIRSFSTMIREILDRDVYTVYGNEEKIRENEDLFRTLVKITE
ncbi:MAG: insulinase family protein [Bacteroides sp.]|jgi:Zn-dependent M16 (insulinase) family peptidase|nr:insulinase family protein [Bacteroides sp.]